MRLFMESHASAAGEATAPPRPARRKRRRAATSMEYCVMASFILLVVIAAVQAFGFRVGSLFTSNAAATSQFSPGSHPSP